MATVVYKVADDVSTDAIYPGRFMATVLPEETPQFAFADDQEFNGQLKANKIPSGSYIVGGRNFGCGSSREQAVSCLTGHELVVVARSFARIFLQNSVNLGLKLVTCPEIEANPGDELKLEAGELVNTSTGRRFAILPLPKSRQAIIDAGGLIAYTRSRLLREAANRSVEWKTIG